MKVKLSTIRLKLTNFLISSLLFLIIFFITGYVFPCNAKIHTTDFPFSPGEKLTFKLKWCFIPAGEAVLIREVSFYTLPRPSLFKQ
jgi:hypothetical protein